MAFYVAQLRKESEGQQTYMAPVQNITNVTIPSPNPFQNAYIIGESTYSDFALSGTFEMGKVYYLRFKIHKVPQCYYSGQVDVSNFSSSYVFSQADILNFRLLLKNDDQTDEEKTPPEQIGTFSVPQALSSESNAYSSYSFIFTPSKTFNRLVFRMVRIGFDELIRHRDWLIDQLDTDRFKPTEGEIKSVWNGNTWINVTVKGIRINHGEEARDENQEIIETGVDGDMCFLKNIIPQGIKNWIKLGYQSRPGSLIVINGEPIRVGRSGIYQINNGTKIESFMIASPNGSDNEKIDAFLLDYAYTSVNK